MNQSLKTTYYQKIRPQLQKELNLKNIEAVPKITKITLNSSSPDFKSDKDLLTKTKNWLTAIAGQAPVTTKAKQAIAGFNLRQGDVVGLKVTLRGQRMYDFFQKFTNLVLPRFKDFQGLNPKQLDAQANYTLGLTEQIVFPEVDYDKIGRIQGLEISITTSTKDKKLALSLLQALGLPFTKQDKDKKAK